MSKPHDGYDWEVPDILKISSNGSPPEEYNTLIGEALLQAVSLGGTVQEPELLRKAIESKVSRPLPPSLNESLAFTIYMPKTAALAFDRIYRPPLLSASIPEDIGFYFGTSQEAAINSFLIRMDILGAMSWDVREKYEALNPPIKDKLDFIISLGDSPKTSLFHSKELKRALNGKTVTLLDPKGTIESDLRPGTESILTTAISNIALVDEDELSWEQVREFRKDPDIKTKYRRFVRWTAAELKNKGLPEIEDSIALKLDDYEFALKKHGIKNRLGTLSGLFDPRFLGVSTAAASLTAASTGVEWGALMGAGLAIGKALVSFGTASIESESDLRKLGNEIAYIHEVKTKLCDKK